MSPAQPIATAKNQSEAPTMTTEQATRTMETVLPRCVRRYGKPCFDCVECLAAHPAGKTCNDCAHVRRCKAMFGTQGDEAFCQFLPARSLFLDETAR